MTAKRPLRFLLNWKFQGPNAPFLLAEDAGLFAAEGFDVTFGIGEGTAAIPGEIDKGAWDAGFGDFNALIEQHARRPGSVVTTLYSIFDRAPMVVASKRSRLLLKPRDLVGKTLCAPVFDTGYQMFPALARAAGFDPGAVKLMPAAPAERDALLVADKVDGVIVFDATLVFALRALGEDPANYSFMYYADNGVDVYSSALMASRDWLKRNPGAGAALVRVVNRCWIEAMRNPEAAVDAVLRRDPSADRVSVRDHLQWVIDHQVRTPVSSHLGLGAMLAARVERNIDIVMGMASKSGTAARPAMAALYDGSFLPPLAERAAPA